MCVGQLRTRRASMVARTCEHIPGAQMRRLYVVDSSGGQSHDMESIQTACRGRSKVPISPLVMAISTNSGHSITDGFACWLLQGATFPAQRDLKPWICRPLGRGRCAADPCGADDCTTRRLQRCFPRCHGRCLAVPPNARPCIAGVLLVWLACHCRKQTALDSLPTLESHNKSSGSFGF